MKTLKTWQSAGTATTTWNYEPYRGWLNNKRYPNATTGEPSSVGPDYTYTAGGRLKTRTWARLGTGNQRIGTTYLYGFDDGEADNDHDDVVAILYSNDPVGPHDTSFSYDRRGRRVSATRNGITTTFIYDDANELLTESHGGGTLSGLSVSNAYNNQLQRETLKVMTNGTTELQSVAYGYDTAGRLETVTEGNYSATYAYHANSPLIDTVTFKNG